MLYLYGFIGLGANFSVLGSWDCRRRGIGIFVFVVVVVLAFLLSLLLGSADSLGFGFDPCAR
jgi:hypothetical protein